MIKKGEYVNHPVSDLTQSDCESEWKTVGKPQRKRKNSKSNDDQKTNQNQKKPNQITNDSAQSNTLNENNNEYKIKIYNHSIKPGNPLHLKTTLYKYNIPMPQKQFYSRKFQITTLEFIDKRTAVQFLEKVPIAEFGPQASYELYKPIRNNPAPRNATQDWNAVILGVEPEIDIQDFEKEL